MKKRVILGSLLGLGAIAVVSTATILPTVFSNKINTVTTPNVNAITLGEFFHTTNTTQKGAGNDNINLNTLNLGLGDEKAFMSYLGTCTVNQLTGDTGGFKDVTVNQYNITNSGLSNIKYDVNQINCVITETSGTFTATLTPSQYSYDFTYTASDDTDTQTFTWVNPAVVQHNLVDFFYSGTGSLTSNTNLTTNTQTTWQPDYTLTTGTTPTINSQYLRSYLHANLEEANATKTDYTSTYINTNQLTCTDQVWSATNENYSFTLTTPTATSTSFYANSGTQVSPTFATKRLQVVSGAQSADDHVVAFTTNTTIANNLLVKVPYSNVTTSSVFQNYQTTMAYYFFNTIGTSGTANQNAFVNAVNNTINGLNGVTQSYAKYVFAEGTPTVDGNTTTYPVTLSINGDEKFTDKANYGTGVKTALTFNYKVVDNSTDLTARFAARSGVTYSSTYTSNNTYLAQYNATSNTNGLVSAPTDRDVERALELGQSTPLALDSTQWSDLNVQLFNNLTGGALLSSAGYGVAAISIAGTSFNYSIATGDTWNTAALGTKPSELTASKYILVVYQWVV